MVTQILKRLSDSQMDEKRRRKRNNEKLAGLSAEEIRLRQKELFDREEQFDESDDIYQTETPSARVEGSANNSLAQQDQEQYWAEYKSNWMAHN